MRILLAVDGSPYTQKMLDYLATHAEWLGDTHSYVALTVQPPLPPRAAKALGKELVNDYHVEEAQKVLAPVHQFVETHKLNAQCESNKGYQPCDRLTVGGEIDRDAGTEGNRQPRQQPSVTRLLPQPLA